VCLHDERVDHCLGVFALHPSKHHIASLSLYERRDLAIIIAEDQVTFPVSRYGSIFGFCRPLADRDRVTDAANICLGSRLIVDGALPLND